MDKLQKAKAEVKYWRHRVANPAQFFSNMGAWSAAHRAKILASEAGGLRRALADLQAAQADKCHMDSRRAVKALWG